MSSKSNQRVPYTVGVGRNPLKPFDLPHLGANPIFEPVAWVANLVCLPLWLLNGGLPARYFTTWFHALVIVYLSLALTRTWQADWAAALTWILSLYLPPASVAIMVWSVTLRNALIATLTLPGFILHQLVTHLAPSLLVWILLPVPHPTPMVGSTCTIGWIMVYSAYLYWVMDESPTDNYCVDAASAEHVLVVWFASLIIACFIGEVLFAVAPTT